LIDDSMSDQVKEPSVYERVVTSLPHSYGQFTLDADDKYLYWGGNKGSAPTIAEPQAPNSTDRETYAAYTRELYAYFEARSRVPSEIFKINIQTGKIDKILDVNFQIGHLQANPWTPGEVFFNKFTGGQSDQKIWSVRSDGSNFRPIYVETPDEWVTHVTVTGPDEVMFVISGHTMFLREKPSGIAAINVRNNQMMLLGQIPNEYTGEPGITGGFWHCQGSLDGRWAVGDTFLGKIILIDRATSKQILLSAGHPMIPDHAHPAFSRNGKRILIQSALLTDGKNLNLMVLNVPY